MEGEGLDDGVQRGDGEEKSCSPATWNSKNWNGDPGVIRDHLATTLLPQDVHQHIDILLDDVNPARFAEPLAFLLNSASQLST
ncbi:hypothetical protein CCR75_003343 [Bremia lactucae]|uniref:Uncharacterized protein n=1 Tax=Bremia lactucae TaxID=4779 RepID=A0A976ID20_BRELC|nr:hypothetical protein CCR75_003343 [Bremia lactucae]